MTSSTSGVFQAKLQSSITLLTNCSLLHFDNKYPTFLPDIASRCRNLDYKSIWRLLLEESCFRVLLTDYSFFTVDKSTTRADKLSISYYGCPYLFTTLEDYIFNEYGEECLDLKHEPDVEQEFLQSMDSSPVNDHPVTFRYDYDIGLYKAGRHPASHLHVGINNDVRIGCRRILNPLSFFAFVIRHQYPEKWLKVVLENYGAMVKGAIRNDIVEVPPMYYCQEKDTLEMYLD